MLSCLQSAHRVFGMHSIGQDYIDDVHIWVVLDRVIVLVVLDIPWSDSVSQRELVGLVGMATHERYNF